MNEQELKDRYLALYEYMANSKKPENMKAFGRVMTAMMDDMISTNPAKAEEYIDRLESIKWKNYLTPKEAEAIVAAMQPRAPWGREQWADAMERHGYQLEEWPCYNRCALWVTMDMIMSDSSETITKYFGEEDIFPIVYSFAKDKLKDADGRFNIRHYFSL